MTILLFRNFVVILAMTLMLMMTLMGCSSRPILPDQKGVKVSREAAAKDCKELGVVTGRAATAAGTQAEALEDLKAEAANKGSNYVVVKQYTATAATGIAYDCP